MAKDKTREDRERLEDALEEFKSATLDKFDAEIDADCATANYAEARKKLERFGINVTLPQKVT